MLKKSKKNKILKKKTLLSKDYSNPYFRKKTSRKSWSFSDAGLKIKFISFIILGFSIFLVWFFIYSPVFKIKNISVELKNQDQVSSLSEDDILEFVNNSVNSNFVLVPSWNFFYLNVSVLEDALDENFAFDMVKVSKKFPNKLFIKLEEVKYEFVWNEFGTYYYADKNGKIIKNIAADEIKEYFPIVKNNSSNYLVSENKINIDNKFISFLLKVNKELQKNENINYFEISDSENKFIKMYLISGPYVLFNTDKTPESQLVKLKTLKEGRLKNDFYNKEYIDLRYGDMVYYK